jgi:hypothetical protein
MKRSNLGAILLTFLMLLLVLTSAVVFLANRNRELDEQANNLTEISDVRMVTRSQLESDLAVLESAYESAGATIEASDSQLVSSKATLEAVVSRSAAEASPTPAEELLLDPEPQLLIFAPSDGAAIRPLETITLYMAAHDRGGIDRIELVINGGQPILYPAGGLITFTLPVRWYVPAEGTYAISARAIGDDDQASRSETIVVEAFYQSDEDRAAALLETQLADLSSVRFPGSALETVTPPSDSGGEDSLHLQMLTGWDGFDPQGVYSRTLAFQAFNFLPSGYNLGDYQQSIEGMIIAFMNPDSGNPISVGVSEGEDPLARWAKAHELAHRIQDESFQLGMIDFTALDSDARTALRAMIEGEAALLQYSYFNSDAFTDVERDSIGDALEAAESSSLDTLPMFLRQDFEFAFTEGFDFSRYIYEQGGFTALDSLWRNPPQSTEQILHPERYVSKDVPQYPHLPALEELLGDGWRLIEEDSFGEFYLREYMAQTLSPEEAAAAANGWDGGKYAVYASESSSARLLLLRLAWDSAADQEEFQTAYRDSRTTVWGARVFRERVAVPVGSRTM